MTVELSSYIVDLEKDNDTNGFFIYIFSKRNNKKYKELFSEFLFNDFNNKESDLLGLFLYSIENFFLVQMEDLQGENEFFDKVLGWDKSFLVKIYDKHVDLSGDNYHLDYKYNYYIM